MTSFREPAESLTARAAFERAYVAIGYVLDRRGVDLTLGLTLPSEAASGLVTLLSHPDRQTRAERLASELSKLAYALDAQRPK